MRGSGAELGMGRDVVRCGMLLAILRVCLLEIMIAYA